MQDVYNLLFNSSTATLYDDDGEVKKCDIKPEEILLDFPAARRGQLENDRRRFPHQRSITICKAKGSTQGKSLKAYQVPNLYQYDAKKCQPDLENISFDFKYSRRRNDKHNDHFDSASTLPKLEPSSDGI
mmetsp:Transcript_34066/g.48405  ORF Transcript_34066/g.48405 Transcript_34066/m.48405 type:complete len:130 (+) Transcript_34066:220-609(+)